MEKSLVSIVVVNLGSPKSPKPNDVGKYLNEFLTDPYVINLPTWIRYLLVKACITPFRKYRSAKAYRSIWNTDGGPLRTITCQVAAQVEETTGIKTLPAMRYGEPSIHAAIQQLQDYQTIFLALQYPQHADSTRTTSIRYTEQLIENKQLIVAPPFYNDTNYLNVLVNHTKEHLRNPIDHVLISFHSLPESHIKNADPTNKHCLIGSNCCEIESIAHSTCYRHQCLHTAKVLGESLGLPYSISFQSRLGRAKWLEPTTEFSLKRLAQKNVKNLAVVCPGFTADNLETLEEIGIQGKNTFMINGGKSFQLIPCLNSDKNWISFLSTWILQQLNITT